MVPVSKSGDCYSLLMKSKTPKDFIQEDAISYLGYITRCTQFICFLIMFVNYYLNPASYSVHFELLQNIESRWWDIRFELS